MISDQNKILEGLGDSALAARLHARCFTPGQTGRPWSEKELKDLARNNAIKFLRIEKDSDTQGLMIWQVSLDECDIISICVTPEMRRKGLASALLRESIKRCRQDGITTAFLEVAEDNDAAISLYIQHGFNICGRRKGYYQRPGTAVDAMVLSLNISAYGK